MLAPLRGCHAALSRAFGGAASAAVTPLGLRSTTSTSAQTVACSANTALVSARTFRWNARLPQAQAAVAQSPSEPAPITRFQDLQDRDLVHRNVVRTLTEDMGLETMTHVQSATISQALTGSDIIAQAKTGTGKTLGFLLPMLQNIISRNPALAQKTAPPLRSYRGGFPARLRPDIRAIIVSPTRELAEQIAMEARRVTARTAVKVQTAVGGTGKRDGMRRIMSEGCNVLVATPGRLNDILSDAYNPVPVENLDYFIYDEADRLLETGFLEEIRSIQAKLPAPADRHRQTLMFSATVPNAVVKLVRETLKPGFHFVKTVRDDEEPTHQRVPQRVVRVRGYETQLPALLELCTREAELSADGTKRPFKALVYFNSMKETQLSYDVFRRVRRAQKNRHALWQGDLLFIHSGLTQTARQKAADTFRAADRAILFSTDVTSRGMDFPNVTHVIQMGLPRDDDDYVHRIGRTGRAGKEGEGWLILPDFNTFAVRSRFGHLPIKEDASLQTAHADLGALGALSAGAQSIIEAVRQAFSMMDPEQLEPVFSAMLAANPNSNDKSLVVDSMRNMALELWGLETMPYISPTALTGRSGRRSRPPGAGRWERNDRSGARGPSELGGRSPARFRDHPPSGYSGGSPGRFGDRSAGRPHGSFRDRDVKNRWSGRGSRQGFRDAW